MNEKRQLTRRKLALLLAGAGLYAPSLAHAQFSFDLGAIGDIGRLLKGISIDEEDEINIGEEMFPEFIAETGGTYLNHDVQRAVAKIADVIFGLSERMRFNWDIHVVDSNEVNAWALPGGKIGVNKGLLRYVSTEEELAAVIAHEAGHVEYSHAAREMKKKAFYAGLSAAAQTAAVAALDEDRAVKSAGIAGLQVPLFKLVTAGYSRDFEREADQHILKIFSLLGRDVKAGARLFETLMEIAPRKTKRTTSLFSGHPDTKSRIQALLEAAPTQSAPPAAPSSEFETIKTVMPTRRFYMRTPRE